MVAVVLGLGAAIVAPLVLERGRETDVAPMTLSEACTRLIAYRDADSGREWTAALADLRGVVHRLPADQTAPERAAWTYANATVGPPTAGPARYLVGADRACRAVGQPLLPGW